jgi:hypothetical protein
VEYSGSIGQSNLGNSISIIGLHLPKDRRTAANTDWERVDNSVESVLFTGYLLSVDYVSINAAMGLLLQLLHGYANQRQDIISMLKHKTIWIVPILNVDALDFLLNFFKSRNSITFIYKNRKEDNYTNEDKCGRNGLGVNLNKNFPVGFNYDADLTSEDYPCSTNYGGVAPLSEAETKGLDQLIKRIKPSLYISLFTAAKMITFPNLEMLDKKDPTIESYKKYISTLALYNEFKEGVTLYDPLKHEKSSLYSKGGNLDEYLLYQNSNHELKRHFSIELLHRPSVFRKQQLPPKKGSLDTRDYRPYFQPAGSGLFGRDLCDVSLDLFSIHNMQETYCKSQETCFPHLTGVIDNYYYGIKLRLMDLGTKGVPTDAMVCLTIPESRNYYIDKVFDKSKKPVDLVAETVSDGDQGSFQVKTQCFHLNQLDRYGYKYYYLILRRADSSSSANRGESEQEDTDLKIFFKDYQQCNSMSLSCSIWSPSIV